MGQSPASPLLDYGRTPPIRQRVRRWGVRLLILGWAAFTFWLAYDKWGEWVPAKGELLRQQRACLAFTLPPGTIVYESPGEKADTLLQTPNYRGEMRTSDFFSTGLHPAAMDVRMQNLLDEQSDARSEMDRLHNRRYPYAPEFDANPDHIRSYVLDDSGPSATVNVFLHGLKAPGGVERLIYSRGLWFFEKGTSFEFHATSEPVEGWTTGHERRIGDEVPTVKLRLRGVPTRIYAGQLDPTRPDRFIIDYLIAQNRFRIQGVLLPTGVVELTDLGLQGKQEGN